MIFTQILAKLPDLYTTVLQSLKQGLYPSNPEILVR